MKPRYNHNKRKQIVVGCDELTVRTPFVQLSNDELLTVMNKLYRMVDTNGVERKPVRVVREYGDVPVIVWEIKPKRRK